MRRARPAIVSRSLVAITTDANRIAATAFVSRYGTVTPGKYDLDLYRGDSYVWEFRLWTDEARTDPVDLSTATVAAQIRDKSGGAIVIDLACEVVAGTAGPPPITTHNTIRTTLAAALWDDAPGLGAGVWDLEVTYADGTVQTVLAGKATATPDVTNSIPAAVAAAARTRLRSA